MQFLHPDQSHIAILWEQSDNKTVVMLPDRIVFAAYELATLPIPKP